MERIQQRFAKKFIKCGWRECWEWTGAVNSSGYGSFSWLNRREGAHRVAYKLQIGDIPKGLCVCHRCDNRLCVNPGHLFLGTKAENNADMATKGRSTRGSRNPQAKLTEKQVRRIRADYEPRRVTQAKLAKRYGVHEATIWRIIHRVDWAHL